MHSDEYEQLRYRIVKEEGFRNKMYKDSKGIWTIGVGYNIEERGLPTDIINELLKRTLAEAERDARKLDAWHCLDSVRQTVLVAMVFQMGLGSVRKFKKALQAMCDRDWQEAHDQMLDSKWARDDSPGRAHREANIMLTGELDK